MARIRVLGRAESLEGPLGEDLLEILQQNGHPISTSCGGVASCGLCRLTVVSGSDVLTPIKAEELVHLGNVAKVIGMRLACQSQVCKDGEVVLDVPLVQDVEERKRRKADRLRSERRARREEVPSAGAAARAEHDRARREEVPSAGTTARVREVIEWRPGRTGPKGG